MNHHIPGLEHDVLVCECGSTEHTAIISYCPPAPSIKDPPGLTLEVHLSNWMPWHHRLWNAIKYIFGYKCKYGDFDCILLDKPNAIKLRNICDRFLREADEFQEALLNELEEDDEIPDLLSKCSSPDCDGKL